MGKHLSRRGRRLPSKHALPPFPKKPPAGPKHPRQGMLLGDPRTHPACPHIGNAGARAEVASVTAAAKELACIQTTGEAPARFFFLPAQQKLRGLKRATVHSYLPRWPATRQGQPETTEARAKPYQVQKASFHTPLRPSRPWRPSAILAVPKVSHCHLARAGVCSQLLPWRGIKTRLAQAKFRCPEHNHALFLGRQECVASPHWWLPGLRRHLRQKPRRLHAGSIPDPRLAEVQIYVGVRLHHPRSPLLWTDVIQFPSGAPALGLQHRRAWSRHTGTEHTCLAEGPTFAGRPFGRKTSPMTRARMPPPGFGVPRFVLSVVPPQPVRAHLPGPNIARHGAKGRSAPHHRASPSSVRMSRLTDQRQRPAAHEASWRKILQGQPPAGLRGRTLPTRTATAIDAFGGACQHHGALPT